LEIMNQNNIVNFGKLTLIQVNFNLFRTPKGPKLSKLPLKRLLAIASTILAWVGGGAVQAPLVAQPLKVEIVSPAPNSTFSVGSTIPLVGRVTGTGKVKSVEFRANHALIGMAETRKK